MRIAPARAAVALALLLAAACDSGPVQWEDATAGDVVVDSVPPLASLPTDAGGHRCDASLRAVRLVPKPAGAAAQHSPAEHAAMMRAAGGPGAGASADTSAAMAAAMTPGRVPPIGPGDWVAVWWSARPDSSARLLSARTTDDGRTWAPAIPVDTFDRGARGCARPAPGVSYEPASQYVHVAYFLDAPEGAGVFYAHSMDAGILYDPKAEAIAYGPRLSRAAVAAWRDTVVVAYEDPNGREPAVVLALSGTGGHIFPEKAIDVSGRSVPAMAPAVEADSAGVVVRWTARRADGVVAVRRRGRWR